MLVKQEGEITAFEVKSSMTYSTAFEDTLKRLPEWIHTPVARRAVVYNGDFENQAGDIALVNYRRLPQLLEV